MSGTPPPDLAPLILAEEATEALRLRDRRQLAALLRAYGIPHVKLSTDPRPYGGRWGLTPEHYADLRARLTQAVPAPPEPPARDLRDRGWDGRSRLKTTRSTR
jgi:hypothetical protein